MPTELIGNLPPDLVIKIVSKLQVLPLSRFRRTCFSADQFVDTYKNEVVVRYDRLSITVYDNLMVIAIEHNGRQLLRGEGFASLAQAMSRLGELSEFCIGTVAITDNSCNLNTRNLFATMIKPFVEYFSTTRCHFSFTGFAFTDQENRTGFHAT